MRHDLKVWFYQTSTVIMSINKKVKHGMENDKKCFKRLNFFCKKKFCRLSVIVSVCISLSHLWGEIAEFSKEKYKIRCPNTL